VYEERRSRLPGAVVWRRTVPADGVVHPVLPDGCLDLIWVDGRLLIAGPDTGAYLPASVPGATYAGVRFPPGTGPSVIGLPASEVRDRRVPLADAWPPGLVRRLTERVGLSGDPGAALEDIAGSRFREAGPPDRAAAAIVHQLRAGASVSTTADAVGLTERALHRRSLTWFGYGPKTLARILRMNRALGLARTGAPFAEVAVAAGYADQAHLAREVRALAGVPLGVLVG
jgi:AraC-like DNA-binding protein